MAPTWRPPSRCCVPSATPIRALGSTGVEGVSTFSHAMHNSHAPRMAAIPQLGNKCYACHPGIQTECQRDVHLTVGITCTDCHGDMADVGDVVRVPWVRRTNLCAMPRNTAPEFDYEEPGKLFKESKGHGGVHCAACHGPQHATGPAVTDADNRQAMLLQGHAGVINDCRVCHVKKPEDDFFHSLDDDGGGDGENSPSEGERNLHMQVHILRGEGK